MTAIFFYSELYINAYTFNFAENFIHVCKLSEAMRFMNTTLI